jgi:hypothetical protein
MKISSMSEATARFWTVIFGAVTACSLIAGGVYTLVQYFDARSKDRHASEQQSAATALASRQTYNNQLLQLCSVIGQTAAQVANNTGGVRDAEINGFRGFLASLTLYADQPVLEAGKEFDDCVRSQAAGALCSLDDLAKKLNLACRANVRKAFEVDSH